jgi:hypothetical protein
MRRCSPADLLRAHRLALALVRAAAESQPVHPLHEVHHALIVLDAPLREQAQVRDLGRHKQHGRRVLAGRHARPAPDAGRGVHGPFRHRLWHEDGVGLGRAADVHGRVPAGLNDAVEGGAIDAQVLADRKGLRPKRLERDGVAVLEPAHVELADGAAAVGAVRDAVDQHAAHAADALAAVRVEGDRVLALGDQALVQHVEHLEERHVLDDVLDRVRDEAA